MIKYLLLILFITGFNHVEDKLYFTKNGYILFRSEAQQEIIKASSTNLTGVLNVSNRTFGFKVAIRTFQGFNNPLQQEHFNEKYLESEKYPEATFSGKIIEDIDLSIDGTYEIRAKGNLNIHGINNERIIKNNVIVKNGIVNIESYFNIILSDYNIKVPKVVHEKIASEIIINLKAELHKR